MFHMMNGARIGVGTRRGRWATPATSSRSTTRESVPGPPHRPAGKDATRPQVPIIEHADVRRMLLAQKSYVEGALALVLYCSRLVDEQQTATTDEGGRRRAAAGRADTHRQELALPVVPGGQQSRHPGPRRLRLHARLRRGAALPRQPSQPHPRGHARHPGPRPARAQGDAGRWRRTERADFTDRGHDSTRTRRRGKYGTLGDAIAQHLEQRAGGDLTAHQPRRPAVAMANSSVYLDAVGHTVIAWMWLEQMTAVDQRHGDFYDGKRTAGALFLHPRAAQSDGSTRSARQHGYHHARYAPGMVLGASSFSTLMWREWII